MKATRPLGLPSDAVWDERTCEWVSSMYDARGRRHGIARFYRADGTLVCAMEIVNGVPHGPFERYHPDGSMAQRGAYAFGSLDGTLVSLRAVERSGAEIGHGLGQLDRRIARLEVEYAKGAVIEVRAFDDFGRPIAVRASARVEVA